MDTELFSKLTGTCGWVRRDEADFGAELKKLIACRLKALSLRATEASPMTAVPDKDRVSPVTVLRVIHEVLFVLIRQHEIDRRQEGRAAEKVGEAH